MYKLKDAYASGRVLATIALVVMVMASGCGGGSDDDQQPIIVTGSSGADTGSTATTGGGSTSGATQPKGDGSTASSGSKADSPDQQSSPPTDSDDGFKPVQTPIQLYVSGTSSVNVSEPTVEVARNASQLASLKRRQVAGTKEPEPSASVNFRENRQAIAVFLPESPSGTQVMVSGVSTNGKASRVTAIMFVPAKGCKSSGKGSARPTAWVETTRLSGKTSLVVRRVPSPC